MQGRWPVLFYPATSPWRFYFYTYLGRIGPRFFTSSTDKFAKFKDRLFDILDRDPVADSSGNKKGGGYPFGLTLDDHATVQSRWIVSGGGQPFAKDIYLEFCAILLMNCRWIRRAVTKRTGNRWATSTTPSFIFISIGLMITYSFPPFSSLSLYSGHGAVNL